MTVDVGVGGGGVICYNVQWELRQTNMIRHDDDGYASDDDVYEEDYGCDDHDDDDDSHGIHPKYLRNEYL